MARIVVTGGAGFIGFNITKFLSFNREYEVTVADNFFRGKMDDVFSEHIQRFNIKVINADFTDMKSFSLLENDYDYVYFLAAVVGVKYTEEIPNELIRINTFLTINTLEWLKESKCKKVLFTSTSECYAGTIESFGYTVPTDEEVPLSINDITNPRFTYAVTKMLGESGFYHYSRIFGFDCTIVRYHNVYGPRMGFKHVIPQVVQRFLQNEDPFLIYGYDQTRSFNYIDDAVNGTVLAMEKDNTNGQIFHIGDMRDEIKIETLVRFIGETMGYNGLYEYVPAPDGSVSRRCPDISKATRILGYEPLTTWQAGVKNTVTWYKEYIEAGGNVFE
jgi:nucleoside-diphosphate-sugar epimerase